MENTEELRKEAAEKKYPMLKTMPNSAKITVANQRAAFKEGAEWEAERGRWMPIETAPKDGTKITVAIIDGNENHYYPTTASYRCYHQNSKGKEMFRDRNGIKLEKLTHWMPITPPKTSKQ